MDEAVSLTPLSLGAATSGNFTTRPGKLYSIVMSGEGGTTAALANVFRNGTTAAANLVAQLRCAGNGSGAMVQIIFPGFVGSNSGFLLDGGAAIGKITAYVDVNS